MPPRRPATRATCGSTLFLLADGRLPTGGHAHSGGLEAAVAAGRVSDAASLAGWLTGRLATTGRIDAACAIAAHRLGSTDPDGRAWVDLVAEWEARTPSPAQRSAARAQGRGLLRAATRAWALVPGRVLPWPVALGAVARHVGLDEDQAALLAATASVNGPAWAATRLLSLDPFEVATVLASMAAAIDDVAAAAIGAPLLPAPSAPLTDIGAQAHAAQEVRLFAS